MINNCFIHLQYSLHDFLSCVDRFIHVLLKSDFWTSGRCLSILQNMPFTTSLSATVLSVVQLIVQDEGIDCSISISISISIHC